MEDQADQSCFIPEISVSFQKSFFFIINWFSPVTMLLSIWCVVSNAAVIIALYRIGFKSIRPGLLMLCSLSFTDLLWGATVAPVESGLRLKHLLNTQVCEVYSEITDIPLIAPPVVLYAGTIFNLAILSIDRFLAVKCFAQYRFWVTRRRALVACVVVWVTSITLGALREHKGFRSQSFNSFSVGIIIFPAAVIIICQSMTIYYLRRHNNKVEEMRDTENQTNSANTVNAAIERRLSKTTAYVVGVLALVFIPISTGMIITAITKKEYIKLVNRALIPLATICSCINPMLYYRGNKRVKGEILKLIKCQ